MVSSIASANASALSALQKLLSEADVDADAVVSESELVTALSGDSSAAAQLVTEADTDGDGAIALSEFASFAEKFSSATGLALLSAQEDNTALVSAFTAMDSGGDAKLDADEITAAVTPATTTEETTAEETATEETASDTTSSTMTTTSDTSVIDDLLASVDATGDGVYNKSDVAKLFLDADQDAARKRAAAESSDTTLLTAAYDPLDTDKDGVVSTEEKAIYSS